MISLISCEVLRNFFDEAQVRENVAQLDDWHRFGEHLVDAVIVGFSYVFWLYVSSNSDDL